MVIVLIASEGGALVVLAERLLVGVSAPAPAIAATTVVFHVTRSVEHFAAMHFLAQLFLLVDFTALSLQSSI